MQPTTKPAKPRPLTLNAKELIRMARGQMALERPVRGVDEYWLAALALQESGGNPNAVGDGGRAVGLMQFHRPAWSDVWGRPPEDLPLRTDSWASMRAAIRYARSAKVRRLWADTPRWTRERLSSHHHLGHVDVSDRAYVESVERKYQQLVKQYGGTTCTKR